MSRRIAPWLTKVQWCTATAAGRVLLSPVVAFGIDLFVNLIYLFPLSHLSGPLAINTNQITSTCGIPFVLGKIICKL